VNSHVFVDETQDRGYLLAAAAVLPSSLVSARRTVRQLILPRQRRIHFFKESDGRRKQILVLERDDSLVAADRRVLYQQVQGQGLGGRLRYDHLRARDECLLIIPDAVAWSWARGGLWRKIVKPLVTGVRQV
jgi:hypothetical protein